MTVSFCCLLPTAYCFLRSAFYYICVICRGISRLAFHCVEIDPVQAKPGIETLQPFVVIYKRPVEIAPYIDTVLDAFLKRIDMPAHIFYFFLAVMGCDT